MIVCVLDDLLFSVKISTAAKAIGADIYFERTPGAAVDRIKEKHPSLVILDLNSARLRPMSVIADLKADPLTKESAHLASCPTCRPTRLPPRARLESTKCSRARRSRIVSEISGRG
jgi:CheY-like chemotaxis protein